MTNALPGTRTLRVEIPGVSFDPGPVEAESGQTVTVSFAASAPGTYVYQSSGDAGRQTAMGLYGGLVVRSGTAGQAYDDPATAYDVEQVLVLSALDPGFNAAPDTYDLARMRRLIDEAISARLDGLIVSLPDVQALRAPIRRAQRAGIPVVSINSGSDRFRSLGILAHVGQPEYRAGFEAGQRMARAGVRSGLCVNQEVGNAGLELRCDGFEAGMRRSGGTTREIGVELQDPTQAQAQISRAIDTG